MEEDFELTLNEFEIQLCSISNVNAFKIPPLNHAEGYRCSNWEGHHIWQGRLRVLIKGKHARIVLEDPNTRQVFAECPLDHQNAVEGVIDSCRYFVLRVVNGERHAFIGIGINERSESFDFKQSCLEARKRMKEPETNQAKIISASSSDLHLSPGTKITINIPPENAKRKKRFVENNHFRL